MNDGNILFNDMHSTFYLEFFYKQHPTDMIAHITGFVIPVVAHWLE